MSGLLAGLGFHPWTVLTFNAFRFPTVPSAISLSGPKPLTNTTDTSVSKPLTEFTTEGFLRAFNKNIRDGVPSIPAATVSLWRKPQLKHALFAENSRQTERTFEDLFDGIREAFPDEHYSILTPRPIAPKGRPSGWNLEYRRAPTIWTSVSTFTQPSTGQFFALDDGTVWYRLKVGSSNGGREVAQTATYHQATKKLSVDYDLFVSNPERVQQMLEAQSTTPVDILQAAALLVFKSKQGGNDLERLVATVSSPSGQAIATSEFPNSLTGLNALNELEATAQIPNTAAMHSWNLYSRTSDVTGTAPAFEVHYGPTSTDRRGHARFSLHLRSESYGRYPLGGPVAALFE